MSTARQMHLCLVEPKPSMQAQIMEPKTNAALEQYFLILPTERRTRQLAKRK